MLIQMKARAMMAMFAMMTKHLTIKIQTPTKV